ncbi:hypothetical protein GCM10028786_01870 [Flaviaesturariibacter terrae]
MTIGPDSVNINGRHLLFEDIEAVRYGVKGWGIYLPFGRVNCVDLKLHSGHIRKLRILSVSRIRKVVASHEYHRIATVLLNALIQSDSDDYRHRFERGETITVCGVQLSQEGLQLAQGKTILSWLDIDLHCYWHHFTVTSLSDRKQYRNFYHLKDWNAGLLLAILQALTGRR